MWGRHVTDGRGKSHERNTPTCVGKTGFITKNNDGWKKHPHVCGEDVIAPMM